MGHVARGHVARGMWHGGCLCRFGFCGSKLAAYLAAILSRVRRRVWHKLPRHLHSISTGNPTAASPLLAPLPSRAWQHFEPLTQSHSFKPFTHTQERPTLTLENTHSATLNPVYPCLPHPSQLTLSCSPRGTLVLHAL